MFTEFFSEKLRMRIAGVITVFISLSCSGYAYLLSKTECVELNQSFYFLVSGDMRVEASTQFVQWNGGAGYLLEYSGEQYVAFTVFSKKEEGEEVRKRLVESTMLIQKAADRLYFKGEAKKKQSLYVSALKLLKSYMLLIEDCIGRLENGMTQEACKRILSRIERQFHYAKQSYEDYSEFARVCGESGEMLNVICKKTVYLKDLRYLLCWQAEKYLQLCDEFVL